MGKQQGVRFDQRKCGRCGHGMTVNLRAQGFGLCADCRSSDPTYTAMTRDAYVEDSRRARESIRWQIDRAIGPRDHDPGARRANERRRVRAT